MLENSITQQVTDALGNLTRVTDPNQAATNSGLSTQHNYDALSRLIATLDNLNRNTAYDYNAHDQLTQVTAPNGASTQYRYDDLGNLLQETSPDRGTTTYTYDTAGNVTSQTDARGISVSYRYDALNRLTLIDYPTDTDTVFAYDAGADCTFGIGRLCQLTDGSGTTRYGYDAFGNVTVQVKTELGQTYTTTYAYDLGHRIAAVTYPDGRILTHPRDTLGRLTAVSATVNGVATPITTNHTYRADGLPLSQTYGNGVGEVRQYDQKGQLTYQSLGTADTRVYGYDLNGNLTSKQSLPEVGSYGYDALDRLVNESAATLTASFGYDANGNRLSASVNNLDATLGYAPGSNRLKSVTVGPFTETPVLDPAGNLTSLFNGRITLAYDGAGRLARVKAGSTVLARYTYNAHGQRTRKVVGTRTTVYHYDLAGQLVAETQSNGTPIRAYVYADDAPVAQLDRVIVKKTAADRLIYLHGDALSTPRVGTDIQQRVVWRWEGEAFGSMPPHEDADGNGKRTTINLRFAGQYFDAETGLFYNWNRYYSPQLGRYITSDPIGLRGGMNTYAYVNDNPLRWTDPKGLFNEFPGDNNPGIPCSWPCDGDILYERMKAEARAAGDCITCIAKCEVKVLVGAGLEHIAEKQAEEELKKVANRVAREYAKRGLKFFGWVGVIVTGVDAVQCLV